MGEEQSSGMVCTKEGDREGNNFGDKGWGGGVTIDIVLADGDTRHGGVPCE